MNNKFNYSKLEELEASFKENQINIPISKNIDILREKIIINNKEIPNKLAVHPMEGADSNNDGSPSALTKRRYRRFARGGSGLIWLEAIAVDKGGRANNNQLFLNNKNLNSFRKLIKMIHLEANHSNKSNFNPYLVAQLTHSGRFGEKNNIIFRDEYLDIPAKVNNNYHVMTDRELDKLKDKYIKAAQMAAAVGFDAVDIKSCHRYLLSELLAGHRRKGKYGGSYVNRTRFLREVIKEINNKIDIDLAVRLNIYDAIPYPNGWATNYKGKEKLEETKKLLNDLDELGVKIINVTASTPYLKPHVNRPYDKGAYNPPENQLDGVARLLKLSKFTQDNFSGIVIGTGFSWLRHFSPYIAAGMVEKNWITMAGFGRQAFAYPDFANDIIEKGELIKSKVCITCSKCAELKAAKEKAGCVIRDQEIYLPIYREFKALSN